MPGAGRESFPGDAGGRYLPPGLPSPAISDVDRAYWRGARAGELMVQVCGACAAAAWPPEEICASCHSTAREWRRAGGAGTVFSWTRIWHPVHPALAGSCPYIAVVVALKDFPVLMLGNLLGDPLQDVAIGMPVQAEFEVHDEYALVQWRLIEAGRTSH